MSKTNGNAFAQAERMERLNRAFQKRSVAIEIFKRKLTDLRKESTSQMLKVSGDYRMKWAQLIFEAAGERDLPKKAQLEKDAETMKQQADNLSSQAHEHEEEANVLKEELRDELARIDQEIAALGGNLSLKVGAGHG